jgi:hypothetical protein
MSTSGASPAPAPAPSPDADAQANCSASSPPGKTTQPCAEKKIIEVTWDKDETWCSEGGPVSGTTKNYANGEAITVEVKDKADGSAVTTLPAKVSSDAFKAPWKVLDVLPTGGPSWKDRRLLDAFAGGVKSPVPMPVRFIPNVKRVKKAHSTSYSRTEPGAASAGTVSLEARFELEVTNYLLTIHGALDYVRGIGKERLMLNDASLTGGFTLWGKTNHWGYLAEDGVWNYWDGSAWKPVPTTWVAGQDNHFGIPFYKNGATWTCRDTTQSWPTPLADWPAATHTGPNNKTETVLAKWKKLIDAMWSDKFDLKRKECKSGKPECCRYKTTCASKFTEVTTYGQGTLIIVLDQVRSDSGMWAMGDTRDGLAPHEFGHLLTNPDEYPGVGTTQLGVSGDGMTDGIDDDSIMGTGMTKVKKRHYKGIAEVLALLVSDEFGKSYTYEAVPKGASLASPAGTAPASSSGSASKGGLSSVLTGALIGAVVGAVVGAIIGFVVGGPAGAAKGALAGAAAGALIGAGIGALF